MKDLHRHLADRSMDFWLARGAILVIVALQLGLVNELSVGPRWFAPLFELALLVPLSVVTASTLKAARRASSVSQWELVGRDRRRLRVLAVTLTALSTLMNFGSLAQLIEAILSGRAASGRTLLLDALNIWVTNVVIFALWFWAADRNGPALRGIARENKSDFVFTQQLTSRAAQFKNWSPGFLDYLFLAYTNATAFSPADTFPLTVRAKLLMMAESAISLITIVLVAARAVSILS
jgi:hypothetical protein